MPNIPDDAVVLSQLLLLLALTFVIHLVGTLAYSVRIVGTRTRRLALAFSLFNVLVLVSRMSNTFQAPLLAKHIDRSVLSAGDDPIMLFRAVLLVATGATLAGAMLIPSFQRLLTAAVTSFYANRSLPGLLRRSLRWQRLSAMAGLVALPAFENVAHLRAPARAHHRVVILNVIASGIISAGVLASLYAGYLAPELRATCASLSGVVNGVAAVLLVILIDPHLAVLTDDVMAGVVTEGLFRRVVVLMVGARVLGTLLAQFLLLPAATFIAFLAALL